MKKLLIITNICTLTFLYLTAFKQKSPEGKSGKQPGVFCEPCNNANVMIPLDGLIDLNTANEMANLYKLTAGKDARTIWFSMGTLKRFLWLIEKKSCGLCIDKEKLGVRIYYGRYPQNFGTNQNYANIPGTYGGKHTLFMVPTYNNGGINIDFNPAHKDSCRPMAIKNIPGTGGDYLILSPNARMYTNNSVTNTPSDVIQNHGDLMPPPANISDLGAGYGN